MRITLILITCITMLTSCEMKETPITAKDRGGILTRTVELGNDYRYQIYFSLGKDSIIKTYMKSDWDLAFDCSSDNFIYLNGSKLMLIYKTNQTDFTLVKDTSGFEQNKIWDRSSGHRDSTAFGSLAGNNYVYVIDRGYSETGSRLGFIKFQLTGNDASGYQIRYSRLNGLNEHSINVPKNSQFNNIGVSFTSHSVVEHEPRKDEYDLIFTQYTYTFINPYQPYLVTGVLQNKNGISAVALPKTNFSDLILSDTSSWNFNNKLDNIGYDWKYFGFETNVYVVDPTKNFIIKDRDGIYYKLHFIDFYSPEGKKGYPKFEYQKL